MEKVSDEDFRVKSVNRTFLATVLVSVFAAYVILMVCLIVGKILNATGVYMGKTGWDIYSSFAESGFFYLLVSQILLFIPSGIFILFNRNYFKKNLRIRRLKPVTYLMVAGFGLFFIPVVSFINSLSMLFTQNEMAETISGMLTQHSLISSLIVTAVIPCLFEETIYRGVFYNEYSRINPRKAVLLSALLFGLLHMNFNQFLYAAVGGVVFALIVEATGSITASMMMHFMINSFSVIVSYITLNTASLSEASKDMDINSQEGVQEFSGAFSFMNNLNALTQTIILLGIFAVFCIAVDIVLYIQIALNEGRYEYVKSLFGKKKIVSENSENQEVQSEQKVSIITPALIVAMLICFAVMLLVQFKIIA